MREIGKMDSKVGSESRDKQISPYILGNGWKERSMAKENLEFQQLKLMKVLLSME
jgi:hypothetical protein